jgi:ribonucleotide monophosphatase NagD (HAD superfamily)
VAWENFGKPSPLLFDALAGDLGCTPGDLALVGDDAEFDAAGALRSGCGAGVLVRTGKYRAGDEDKVEPRPTIVAADVADALAQLGV